MSVAARSFSRRDSVLLAICVLLSGIARALPETMRDPLASGLRRSVVAPLISLQHDAEQTRRAWLTREQRALARDSVLLRSLQLDEVRSENERLRRLLGLGSQLEWGFVPAEVLHGGAVSEAYAVTLSAGSRAGVRPFSPVVAADGLAGMVKTADPTLSIAITFAHPDFRVSAMAADGTAFGIVAAHLGNEPERYLLEMRGVAIRNALKPGVLIVSSGLGGVFPRGIPIGVVIGELRTSEVWARTYLLRPAVSPADLAAVMVLLPRRVDRGVEQVWAAGRSADSAVRSVVAAGDSVARASAQPAGEAQLRPAPRAERARPDSALRAATTATGVSPPPPARAATRPDATVPRRDTTRDTTRAVTRDTAAGRAAQPDSAAARREAPRDSIRPDTSAARAP